MFLLVSLTEKKASKSLYKYERKYNKTKIYVNCDYHTTK